MAIGSPPPMRGKVKAVNLLRDKFGITPAYAGKRNECGSGSSRHGDHPRLCGEKKWKKRKSTLRSGSPPPMRGKDEA